MGGDDLTTISGGNKADFRQMDQFEVTSANPNIASIWNGCYKMIQGANNVIANAPKIIGDQPKITGITGEATFFKSSWLLLVGSWFRKRSLITEVTDAITPELLNMQKAEITAIYELIETTY